jgi:hypothetical protein
MNSKKDVEQMNLFELMNEVERLRSKDKTEQLRSEVFQLKHELQRAQATIARLQKSIDFITHGDKSVPNQRQYDRRRQPQGRRQASNRRSIA